jgi:hypothetical protein
MIGRFIKSAEKDSAWAVDPSNILIGAENKLEITISANEIPTNFYVLLNVSTPQLYKIWFTITYNVSKPKTLNTNSFIIMGQGL